MIYSKINYRTSYGLVKKRFSMAVCIALSTCVITSCSSSDEEIVISITKQELNKIIKEQINNTISNELSVNVIKAKKILVTNDKDNNVIAFYSDKDGAGGLLMLNKNNNESVFIGSNEDNSGMIMAYDSNKKPSTMVLHGEKGGQIILYDKGCVSEVIGEITGSDGILDMIPYIGDGFKLGLNWAMKDNCF